MLHSIQQLYGDKLRAIDGEIGHVRDFYIDDKNNWTVRYLVADTDGWLSRRLVLISSHALGQLYPKRKMLLVNLTREQIEKSPSIDEHKPLSRQYEEAYHRDYRYPYYAEAWPLWGLAEYPVSAPPPPVANLKGRVDSHLRSTRFIQGYKVEATDGFIGHLADFLIDGRTWRVGEIVIKAGHWYSSHAIRIPTEEISRISYDDATVYLSSTKNLISVASQSEAA